MAESSTRIKAECSQMVMQVQAACRLDWLGDVILDFLEVHGLKEAVALVKTSGKKCTVCTPRYALMCFPSEGRPFLWKPWPSDSSPSAHG